MNESAILSSAQKALLQGMNLTPQSQKSLNDLISFLNSHSNEEFTPKNLEPLFQVPKLAEALNRVANTALSESDCVLGVDELQVYMIYSSRY